MTSNPTHLQPPPPHIAFRAMGVTKAELIIWLLSQGRHVCLSDVDSAWISPPHALMRSLPEADVLMGTDCINVTDDADRSYKPTTVSRCGFHLGSKWFANFNTGVLIFRARRSALGLAIEWRNRMAEIKEGGIDDQMSFNQLIGSAHDPHSRKPHLYPVKAIEKRRDGRVIAGSYMSGGAMSSVAIAAVPATVFCSAHVYHIQQGAESRDCIVLHLTFVEGWPKNPAKYWRLREAPLNTPPHNPSLTSLARQPFPAPPNLNRPPTHPTSNTLPHPRPKAVGWAPKVSSSRGPFSKKKEDVLPVPTPPPPPRRGSFR